MPNMTIGDINKWISGETDLFFDTCATPPSVGANSNLGARSSSSARLSIRKFARPAIIAVVGAFAAVACVASVSFMQHSAEPLPASSAKSQPSDGRTTLTRAIAPENETLFTPPTSPPRQVIPTPAVPPPKQPPTMVSDAQRAAFLSQVGMWYNHRAKASTASARKPSPPQRVSWRHWPRYSFRSRSDHGEATRLMVDELQQRGVAAAIASELVPPK
jgi:hypothetical protein